MPLMTKNEKSLPAGRQAIVLLSGGLDSATALYLAKRKGYKCFCLIFDYGQRHKREIESARRIARRAGSQAQVIKISLPRSGCALLDRKIKFPTGLKCQVSSVRKIPNTYVPARNIIFLSFAVSFAEAIKAQAIFIGAHSQDYSDYPDCRRQFYRAFSKVISTGTKAGVEKKRIKVQIPLIDKKKSEIIRLGKRLGVPFELTWSCYRGSKVPCGRCDSCLFRAKGFKQAGLSDPLLTKN